LGNPGIDWGNSPPAKKKTLRKTKLVRLGVDINLGMLMEHLAYCPLLGTELRVILTEVLSYSKIPFAKLTALTDG